MSRDNRGWINDLTGGNSEQSSALTDLRSELIRRLTWGLMDYRQADDAFIEDCVQDALVMILDRIDQFEGRSKFLTWATTVAIRIGLGELRRRRWRDVSLDQLIGDVGMPHESIALPNNASLTQSEQETVVADLYSLINNTLTKRQRTALLAELKGMPQVEIARQLGCNMNALYKLTHDARKKLKRGLESAGYAAEELLNTVLHESGQ